MGKFKKLLKEDIYSHRKELLLEYQNIHPQRRQQLLYQEEMWHHIGTQYLSQEGSFCQNLSTATLFGNLSPDYCVPL